MAHIPQVSKDPNNMVLVEGAQMGSSRKDRDIAKLRKNSQNVNRQICLRNFAEFCLINKLLKQLW